MKVFVAGATGAVGRLLVPRLVAAGHAVTGITRRPDAAAMLDGAGARGVQCDVFDSERLEAVMREAAPDVVMHQLTDLPQTLDPRQLAAVYERNDRVRRDGTRNLLSAARACGVARMVVQSMASWYAPRGGMVKTEDDPLWTEAPEPLGAAVRTVQVMEDEVRQALPRSVILRYGGFYGPGTWYARGSGLARMMQQRLVPMVGDGSAVTSLLHVDDAASAAVAAIGEVPGGIYNVADSHPAPIAEWLPAFADAIGAPSPMRAPAFLARLAIGGAMTAWLTDMRGASNARALATLGWAPRYPDWRDGFRTL